MNLKPGAADHLSYWEVADKHDVSKSTLQCLVNGGISMSAFNASKQRLTHAEEHIVVDFCLESADWGFPLIPSPMYRNVQIIFSLHGWAMNIYH